MYGKITTAQIRPRLCHLPEARAGGIEAYSSEILTFSHPLPLNTPDQVDPH